MIEIYFFLSVLTIEVNGSTNIELRQKSIIVEPLLRFPFVHLLANPCGFLLEPGVPNRVTVERQAPNNFQSVSTDYRIPLAPLRNISKEIPLAKQVYDFLVPYRDVMQSVNKTCATCSSMNETKKKENLTQELNLVVSQSLQLIFRIYSPSELRKCHGFQLQSLSKENLLVKSSKEELKLEELYRCLIIITSHLHLMIRDLYDSPRFCPSESLVQLHILRHLTGKLEISMCLILQSAAMTEEHENSNYLKITANVLQSHVHRYFACSAREIQGCLVLRNAHIILNLIQTQHVRPTNKVSFAEEKR